MERISKKFISYLCENDIVEEEKRELYVYALNLLFSGILHFITILLLGFVLGMIKECLLMFIAFFVVRKFAGGYHASSPTKCYIFSVVTNFLMLFLISVLSKYPCDIAFYVTLALSELSIILIPVLESPEKGLNSKEKKVYKVLSVTLSIVITTLAVLIYKFVAVNYGVALCFGLTLVAIVLYLALFSAKFKKEVKEDISQI